MPVIVADNPTIAEHIRYRRPRNQPILETDPDPPNISSILQSTKCKSTISSLLLSTFTTTNDHPTPTTTTASPTTNTPKKKNFPSGTFRGLGCAASSQVSVPAAIRSSASWEAKKERVKKKQRSPRQQPKNKASNQDVPIGGSNNYHPSSVVVPDVWCGPVIGFGTDVAAAASASVDCVVSRRPVSERPKVDADKTNQRERTSYSTRRMVKPELISSLDSYYSFGIPHPGLDVFGARYRSHARYRSPDEFEEIMMLQQSLLMGGRPDGYDRYRNWRLDADKMSYEELLELGDKIGYVITGLKEDEIVHCLSQTKLLDYLFSQFSAEIEHKCSICQEDYEAEDEMGKLECGHFYHIHCIKQWLVQKNICPVCKTVAAAQQ
ncbi:RING-type E3 ubiquitin transferase [Sarracenia purpurea var. burkii]